MERAATILFDGILYIIIVEFCLYMHEYILICNVTADEKANNGYQQRASPFDNRT